MKRSAHIRRLGRRLAEKAARNNPRAILARRLRGCSKARHYLATAIARGYGATEYRPHYRGAWTDLMATGRRAMQQAERLP